MAKIFALIVFGLAAVTAFPAEDVVIAKLSGDDGLRFQYAVGGDGRAHLVDTWVTARDVREAARFNPDTQNSYHLFTRQNPSLSQVLVLNNAGTVSGSNFDPNRRTVVLIHGWLNSVIGTVNTVLVPAFLEAEDVNVVVVDWSAGAADPDYDVAVLNTVTSGEGVARFLNWLMFTSGQDAGQLHIAGHSLGGHQAGIVGRHVSGDVAYITALDPAYPGWVTNSHKFAADDGAYTEVIHTNAGVLGYIDPLGDVDFYPNAGSNMPGCNGDISCDHDRAFYYFAESLTSGGFTGVQCDDVNEALSGNCNSAGWLQMGGLHPKTGARGIFYMTTNAAPPFSRG